MLDVEAHGIDHALSAICAHDVTSLKKEGIRHAVGIKQDHRYLWLLRSDLRTVAVKTICQGKFPASFKNT